MDRPSARRYLVELGKSLSPRGLVMGVSHPASHRIKSVTVIGGFLDGLKLALTDGLNCFIGGRGTGKTTVLELVRFAFDALPDWEEDADEARRISSLVEQNLGGGRVQVEIQTKNGLAYFVTRAWGEEPLVLTADGKPTNLTLKSGSVFRADIYSQNEIERIADRTVSQLVLIDNFRADELVAIDPQLREVEQSLATNASKILSLEERRSELREEIATLPDVEEKLKAFVGIGGENADAIDQAHAEKALRDGERRFLDALDDELWDYQQRLQNQYGRLAAESVGYFTEDIMTGPNGTFLSELTNRLANCNRDIDVLLGQIEDRVAQERQQLETVRTKITAKHDQQELVFRQLIEKHEAAMEQATERSQLESLRNNLMAKRRTLEVVGIEIADLRSRREELLVELSELRDKRFSIRQQVAKQINDRLLPEIRVSVEQFGETGAYQEMLAEALAGARIQHRVVAQRIATSLPPGDLSGFVKSRNAKGLADQAGINLEQAGKAIDALSGSRMLFDLESVELDDKPRIELKDGDEYKDSLSVSTGQKCTSILPILLLDSDRPLLVDQPEDNLDNRFIYEAVVRRLCELKKNRQLIFVTHNANIPVLGDADKVFVFESNGVKGQLEKDGTVDDCRDEIISRLEGGEDAFIRRKERYKY